MQQKLNHLHPAFAANSSIVLHRFGVDPFYEDFRDRLVKSNQHASRAGTTQVIRNHGVTLRITCRNTTPLFGLGLIDSISPAVIEEVAARQAREDAHIRGRFLGRFGWRGQTQELSSFIRGACAVELGLQVSSHLQAADPLPSADKPLPPGRLDLSDRDCDDLTAFVAGLPAPRRIAPTDPLQAAMLKNGESLFASVGCSTCHRPQLGNVQGIFSDLLVHDMGPALSDAAQAPTITPQPPMDDLGQPIVEPPIERSSYGGGGPIRTRKERNPPQLAVEQPNAWKTPPLWGVADSAPYLHDGRAATLADAILLHGGEAAYSVQCFCSLPPADQSRIIDFLLTLAAPDRTDLPRLVEATSQPTKGPDPTIGHKPKLAMQNKGKQ